MALTDIMQSLGDVRVTQLGCIKIGGLGDARAAQSGGTFRMPRKDSFFTITTMNRTKDRDLVPDTTLMNQLLTDLKDDDGHLRQIPVRVLSDDIEEILQADYAWYGKKTCGARSDGKMVTWYACPNLGPDFGKTYKPPIEEPWEEERHLAMKDPKGNPLFKLHGTFNCVIAAQESRFGGVYKFRTTSLISVKQLYSSLLHISQLTGGVLIGMPLMLVVRPQQVSPNGQATTVHTVHIELRGRGLVELQQQAVQQMQYMLENRQRLLRAQTQYRKLLAAPDTPEEVIAIAEEFHPEARELEPAPDNYLDINTGAAGANVAPVNDAAPAQNMGAESAAGDGAGGTTPASASAPPISPPPTAGASAPTAPPARGRRPKAVQQAADVQPGNGGPDMVGSPSAPVRSHTPSMGIIEAEAKPPGTGGESTARAAPPVALSMAERSKIRIQCEGIAGSWSKDECLEYVMECCATDDPKIHAAVVTARTVLKAENWVLKDRPVWDLRNFAARIKMYEWCPK